MFLISSSPSPANSPPRHQVTFVLPTDEETLNSVIYSLGQILLHTQAASRSSNSKLQKIKANLRFTLQASSTLSPIIASVSSGFSLEVLQPTQYWARSCFLVATLLFLSEWFRLFNLFPFCCLLLIAPICFPLDLTVSRFLCVSSTV